ncbi:MAG: dihydroorotase [Planctomycetota bacterium]|jgi:dihydroorotase|nr:dihydroorotase [Planctomycetota bacterium]
MSSILIKNAELLDPSEELDMDGHLAVRDGLIVYVGADLEEAAAQAGPDAVVVDARGRMATAGLIDMHVHLREPGNEAVETIASGAMAAVAGGFSSVACMPNTDPPVDDEAAVIFQQREAHRAGLANVFPVGAITAGRKGEELAEMTQMAKAGAVAFSDDGDAVPNAGLLRRALSYAKMAGKPVLEHCEDNSLKGEGVMDEGFMSTMLGLKGIPDECEEVIVARDVAMSRLTGGHIHIQHVSTANSVEIIRMAKREGSRVTAEVTPHHLTLTCEAVKDYDPVFKVNPPLRAERDIKALRRGLRDGTIDAIASDHAPHLEEAKELEFAQAPSGMIGLETTLGVVSTTLIHENGFTWAEIIPLLTSKPSDILGLGRGRLKVGLPGDITVIDPDLEWTVDAETFHSKSRNCPFNGWSLRGRAVMTVVGGKVMFDLEGKFGPCQALR